MSKSIDQKVVEMSFDNKNFEKNVTESMGTIDKLKSKLNFDDAGKSFQELEKKASKTEFNSFKNNIDNISVKFDAMQVAAITALTNITNKAVDAGLQLAKSLSIDQITSGFQKFGDKTTNVATLVAQGFDMETVNEQMEKLNWFTDETSYNFVDMVSNISKFTATGKDLEDSVNAMEGIATWAALSGQNAATASRAMYQISQSMGAGFFRREDYKSIQNASMDTREFRQNALDAAEALGVLHKTAEGLYVTDLAKTGKEIEVDINKFADSLTEGEWFTSDVMMKVFNKYSSAVNDIYDLTEETGLLASEVLDKYGGELDAFGVKAFRASQEARTFQDAIDATMDATSTQFMNMFEIIFGEYDKAKVLWTDLANSLWDVFAGPIEELNSKLRPALTDNMYDLSELKEYSETYLNGKTEVLDEVSQAFSDLDHYAARLLGNKLLYEAVDESGNKILDEFGNAVTKTRTGTNVEKILEYAKKVGKDSEKFESYLNEYVTQDEDLKKQIKEFVSVYDSGYTTDAQVMWVLSERVGTTKDKIQELYSLVDSEGLNSDSVQEFINTLSNGDETLNKFIKDYVEGTSTVVKTTTGRQNLLDAFWMAWGKIGDVIDTVKIAFRNVFPESQWSSIYGWTVKIKNAIERIFPSEETLSKIQSFLEGVFTVFKGIGEFLGNIANIIKTGLKPLIDDINNDLLNSLANWGESIKSGYDEFMNSDFINKVYEGVKWLVDKFVSLVNTIRNGISSIFNKNNNSNDVVDLSKLDDVKAKLDDFEKWSKDKSEKIKEKTEKISKAFSNFFNSFKKIDTSGKDKIVKEVKDLNDKVEENNFFEKISEFFEKGKETITKVWEKVRPIFQPIIDILTLFVDKIKELIKDATWDNILKLIKDIVSVILIKDADNLVKNISNLFEGLSDVLTNFSKKIKLEGIATTLKAVGFAILEIAGAIFLVAMVDKDKLAGAVGAIAAILAELEGLIIVLDKTNKSSKFSAASAGKMLGISSEIVALGTALLEISFAIKELAKIDDPDNLAIVVGGISGLLAELTGIVWFLNNKVKKSSIKTAITNSITLSSLGSAIKKVAKAIKEVSDIKDPEVLKNSTIAIGALLAELALIVKFLINNIKKSRVLSAIANAITLVSLGISIKNVAKAVKEISDIKDPEVLKNSTIAIGALLAEISGLVFILNKSKKNSIRSAVGNAITMLSMAKSVNDLVTAVKAISEIGDLEALKRSMIAVGALLGEVTAVIFILNKGNKNTIKSGVGNAIMILSIVKSVNDLVIAVKSISEIGDIEALKNSMISVGALLGEVTAVIFILNKGGKNTIKSGIGNAIMILSIVKSVNDLVTAVKSISEIGDIEALKRSMVAVGALLGEVVVVIYIINNKIDKGSITSAIANFINLQGLMGYINNFAKFTDELRQFSWDDILKAVGAIGLVLEELSLIIGNLDIDPKKAGSFGGIMGALSFSLLILTPVLNALSKIENPEQVVLTVSTLIGVLSLFSVFLSKTSGGDAKNALMSAGAIFLLATALLELVGSLKLMAEMSSILEESAPKIAEAIVSVVQTLILAIPDTIAKIAQSLTEAIPALIEMVVTTIKSVLMGVYESIDSTIDIVLEIIFKVLDAIDANIQPILEKVISVFLKVINTVAANASDIVTALVDLFKNIFDALNTAFGGDIDIEKILEGIAVIAALFVAMTGIMLISLEALATIALLNQIADGLNTFMEKIQPFLAAAKKIDPTSMEGVGHLADAILKLTAASILEGLTAWFKGGADYSKFAKGLEEMAPSIANFGKEMAGVDTEALKNAAQAALYLTEFANNLPREGGLLQAIIGETQSMGDFAQGLIDLAPKLIEYATVIKQLTDEDLNAIDKSINTVKGLAKMADSLPRHGGLWQMIIGEAESMGSFANGLIKLAPRLIEYADEVSKLDDTRIDAINRSIPAVNALSKMADSLPRHGGLVQLIIGDNSLTEFAKELSTFAPHLVNYASKVLSLKDVHIEAITRSAEASMSLVEVSNALAPQGNPVFKWLVGNDTKFSDFASNIGYIAEGLKSYSSKVQGADIEAASDSISLAKSLVEISNTIAPQGDSVISFFFGKQDLGTFGTNLETFGTSLKNYTEKVSGIDDTSVSASAKAVSSIVELLTSFKNNEGKFDSNAIKTFGENLDSFGNKYKEFVKKLNEIKDVDINTASSNLVLIIDTVKNIPEEDVNSIMSLGQALEKLADDGIHKFVNALNSEADNIKTAGENIIGNVITGINNKLVDLQAAADLVSSTITTRFVSHISDYQDAGKSVITNITEGMNAARVLDENLSPMANYVTDLKVSFESVVETISFYDIGNGIIATFSNSISEGDTLVSGAFGAIEVAIEDGVSAIKSYYTDFHDAGMYIIEGLNEGIVSKDASIKASASNLGATAFTALKDALKEQSPSKLTYEVGEYFTQGFANGISGDFSYVEETVNYISDRALDEMTSIIARINERLNDDLDDNFTITPVLDLSQIESDAGIMNRYLNSMSVARVGAVAASESMARRITPQSMYNSMMDKINSNTPQSGDSINNNNFYIQSNDPTEVANEVSRILQKQVERRTSVWE